MCGALGFGRVTRVSDMSLYLLNEYDMGDAMHLGPGFSLFWV